VRGLLPKLAASGTWSGIVPIVLKNEKNPRFFSVWLQAVAEQGNVADVIGWARDVTEQQESEMRFTQFVESLSTGVFFSTSEGEILDANPALVKMWGFESLDDLKKYNARDLYANPEQRAQLVRDTSANGSVQDREITYRRKDGSFMQGRASALAIRDHAGRLLRFQGTIVDVTDRVEIERKLHREQEFVRRLIECFPDLIVVLDREGRFTYVSDRIQAVLGVRPEEYVGKHLGQRVGPGDREKFVDLVESIVSGRKSHVQTEVRARHADGTWKVLRISASPLYDENGKITGIVSSGLDVTESLMIEQQLAQKEKFAAMGEMMVGTAHELNNPLAAILGIAELLREQATDAAARRRADLVLEQARRAANIVQNLLTFSRRPTGAHSKLDAGQIIAKALQSQSELLRQANIEVEYEPPGALPSVDGDEKLLVQVYSNIIKNAAQSIASARENGTGKLTVTVTLVDKAIRVTFADNGGGIPPENMGKIFDPFFTTKRPGGSGLGLTLCHAIVKEHGGRIEAESSPGGGAVFHVTLPISPGSAVPAQDTSPSARESSPAGETLQGHAVLVVDDEEAIREILVDGLSARGMAVHAVGSAAEALSYLASNSCEIIISDFNLPGMGGEEFSREVRARMGNQSPRLVFITGELVGDDEFARFRDEGSPILQKPFHVAALADLLTELLQPQPSPAS